MVSHDNSTSGSLTSIDNDNHTNDFKNYTSKFVNTDSPSYHTNDEKHDKFASEVPVWTILPSYHMYTSVVSKSLNPEDEQQFPDLPTYDDVSTVSSASINQSIEFNNYSTPTSIYSQPSNNNTNVMRNPNLIVADERCLDWQNTILDNIHKLKTEDYQELQIKVKFTKDVGEIGVIPEFIDPSNYEFKQGDFINGYFLVENTGTKPIVFDMFYVLFEGNYKVSSSIRGNCARDIYTRKFLEMFDFSASWHYGHINRLVTEYSNPYECPDLVDPIDGATLSFGKDRTVNPGKLYKRFFTFKIPEKLLDSSCSHNHLTHTSIPPSFGVSISQKAYNSKLLDKIKNTSTTPDGTLKDFSFLDSSITYSIVARFIGKSPISSNNKFSTNRTLVANAEGNEFVIQKDKETPIRVVGESRKLNPFERSMLDQSSKATLQNLFERIDECIEHGNQLLKNMEAQASPLISSSLIDDLSTATHITKRIDQEMAKIKQLYKPSIAKCKQFGFHDENEFYKVICAIQKKGLTSTKYVGTLLMVTPKVIHTIKYIPPIYYCQRKTKLFDDNSWKIEIPFDMEFFYSSIENSKPNLQLPEIKSISAELTCLTIKSDYEDIPFEISYDMLFESNRSFTKQFKSESEYNSNYFEKSIIGKFYERAIKLQDLSKKLGPSKFSIDSELAKDLKASCKMVSKRIRLEIPNIQIKSKSGSLVKASNVPSDFASWEQVNEDNIQKNYRKSFSVALDLTSAKLKGVDAPNPKSYNCMCLVPTFQMCNTARFYYITTMFTLQKGNVMVMNTPLEIEK